MSRPPAVRILLPAVALATLGASSCGAPPVPDGSRMLARVVHQVDAGPRVPGTPGHDAIGRWIETELARLGGRVSVQAFADSSLGRKLELRNILARFGPAGGRPLVLCAHWDTRPVSDQDPDPAHRADPVPGANDGGSGVALLLEMAELMKARPPRTPVELVFFDGEDLGAASAPEQFCLGSRAYARALPPPDDSSRPRAAFLFDMVGDRDLGIYPEQNSARLAANLVAIVLDAARATRAPHFHDEPKYALTDDHMPLNEAGLPAADIIDFDYEAWHTHRDTPDRVSAESLAEVARVAAWIVYRSPLSGP